MDLPLESGCDTPEPEGRITLHLEALGTFSTSKTHEQWDHFPTHALPRGSTISEGLARQCGPGARAEPGYHLMPMLH